jgi:hypothetical protein
MRKVKHILTVFFHSFLPQDIFYPKLLHTRFQFSIKYYVVFISILACVFTGIVVYQFSPSIILSYKNSLTNSLSSFPPEVKLILSNGILDTNQNKPLFLWVYHNRQPLFVFMVHTKDVLDSSRIPLPLVFLGSDRLQISYRGHMMMRPYDKSYTSTISRSTIQQIINDINSYFPSFLVSFYVILLILVPFAFIGTSIALLLISSLLVFVLLRIFIPHIHLKKCIQAGMHGTHLPLFITILLYTLFPAESNIFVMSAALVFIFTLVATYEMYCKEVTPHHSKGR